MLSTTATRPANVGALVLVDPTHEAMHTCVRGPVPEDLWRRWGESRRRSADTFLTTHRD